MPEMEFIKATFDKLIAHADKAIENNEVPISCCFVERETGKILYMHYNLTNKLKNGTKHCEMLCIEQAVTDKLSYADIDVYVTVEPCMMCGYALKLLNIGKTYYIAPNAKFGGVESLYKLDLDCEKIDYRTQDVIKQLQNFYNIGNPSLEPHKRHRFKKEVTCNEGVKKVKFE